MVDTTIALELAVKHCPYRAGQFYGSAEGLALGAGLIYSGVRVPALDRSLGLFRTVQAVVYVLTHECDVDGDNQRLFSSELLVCPIIRFDEWVLETAQTFSEGTVFGMIPDLARDRVYRVFFLPPVYPELPSGGLLYLNQICYTHRYFFGPGFARPVCALSSYAQQILDFKIMNHLLRPKAETLPRLQ